MKPINPVNLSKSKCTTNCPALDKFLSGGIPTNSITELVSESSCGKTQLSLQLLLSSQLPLTRGGLSSSSLYIHTEFPFPIRRLHQLSHFFLSSHSNIFPSSSSSYNPLDHIFVHGVHSVEDLLALLDRLDAFLQTSPVRFIVIDSIAALFRSEFDNTSKDLKRRSLYFFRIAAKLKMYASKFDLAVLVTNQVVDVIGNADGGSWGNGMRIGNFGCLFSSGRRVCPALGLSWANCVNTRLFLSRNEEVIGGGTGSEGGDNAGVVRTRRKLQVVFAPHLPESSCEYVVLREGVFGLTPL